jgi:hypothetical protein
VRRVSRGEAVGSEGLSPGSERLRERLLYLGAELDSIVAFADGRQDPAPNGPGRWLYDVRSAVPNEGAREVLRRWRGLFADELEVVRLARNTVAHAMYISDDNLRNAVAVAEQLVRIARSSVGIDVESETTDDRARWAAS